MMNERHSRKEQMMRRDTFKRGTGVFNCESCGRATRQINDQGIGLRLCVDCEELAGIYNALMDTNEQEVRELYGSEIISRYENIVAKGGKPDAQNQELYRIAKS